MGAPQVLVADHPGAFRSGVSSYLAEDTRYDVVEVDDAEGLVAAGRAGALDVILIDSGMAQSAELQNALATVGASMSSALVWGFGVDGDEVVAARSMRRCGEKPCYPARSCDPSSTSSRAGRSARRRGR